jgi:hypothetical protein
MRFHISVLFYILTIGTAWASSPLVLTSTPSKTDSLIAILVNSGKQVLQNPEFAKRDSANTLFTSTLKILLQEEEGFAHNLDTIRNIIRLQDEKEEVVICTWQMPDEKFQYKRFGMVAARGRKGRIVITELIDQSAALGDEATFKYLKPNQWYGALYYTLLSRKVDGDVFYTLLGYAPGESLNRKVVEVMTVDRRGRPRFGKKVFLIENFEDELFRKPPMRLILKYSPSHVASIKWNAEKEMIIMDHLSPPDVSDKGNYAKYGPDFSYDGLVFEKGWWQLEEEVRFNSGQNIQIRPPAEPAPENN